MKEYFLKNYKTFLAIFFSFFFVYFIAPIFLTPGKLSGIISGAKKLFTLQFSPNNSITDQFGNNNSFNLPTVEPTQIIPTVSNQFVVTTSPTNGLYPTRFITQTPTLTAVPIPTKVPKPTKPPDVFQIDPALARPGKTTDEVFTIASQKTCVPKEILKGIAYIESGSFFDVVPPKYFSLYNSANWWTSQFLTEEKRACGGYDFDNGSGIVPPDSKYAGHNCHSDGSTGATSYIMGPMQANGSEQSKFGSKVGSLLGVKNVDRRVILDAIMIVGLITKQNIQPATCTNWSGHDIVKAACGYYGSCGIADGTYYCATFCRNYKKFGGKGSCDAASFGDNCWK